MITKLLYLILTLLLLSNCGKKESPIIVPPMIVPPMIVPPMIVPPIEDSTFVLTGTWEVWHKKKVDNRTSKIVYEYDTDTVYQLKLSFFSDSTLQRFTLTSTDSSDQTRFAFLLYERYCTTEDSLYEFPDSLLDTENNIYYCVPSDSSFDPYYPVKAYPLNALLADMEVNFFSEVRMLGNYAYYYDFIRISKVPINLETEMAKYVDLSSPVLTKQRLGGYEWDVSGSEFLK